MKPISERDKAILRMVQQHKLVSFRVLAERFFITNPNNGKANKDPLKAARRGMARLKKRGLVALEVIDVPPRETRSVASLTPAAEKLVGRKKIGNVNRRAWAHHVLSLEAAERFCAGREGYTPVLEHVLRQEAAKGKPMFRPGVKVPCLPDVEIRGPDGERIALELVTSKYTTEMITEKSDGFKGRFQSVVWVADRASTAERVTATTGDECGVV